MAKKGEYRTLWWVEHPDHMPAVVVAENWELATVEAAKWWEVPWRRVAALCTLKRKEVLPKFVCVDCRQLFYGRDGNRIRCSMCEAKARDMEANKRAAAKRFWKEMCPVGREGNDNG